MSENGEQWNTKRAGTGSKWVWWSTEESVERGAISMLAYAEVVVGIWLYWWILPWWLETNLHLLISVLVAPLLLLRSPTSVGAALAAFLRWFENIGPITLRSTRIRVAVVMLLAAGLSALASWGLVETWLSGHDGWGLLWRAGIMGWIGVQIGATVTVALAGVQSATRAEAEAEAEAVRIEVAVAVAGAGAVVGGVAIAVAVVIAVAIVIAETRSSILAIWAPGLLLGIWIPSTISRIDSTIRHLAEWPAPLNRIQMFS